MEEEKCPHCGSEDYGEIGGANLPSVCLTCGYDTESGTSGVCPGGKHPKDSKGNVCCDWCWDRPPTNLPDQPRWRSRRRALMRRTRKFDYVWNELEQLDAALLAWLRDHQANPPKGPTA